MCILCHKKIAKGRVEFKHDHMMIIVYMHRRRESKHIRDNIMNYEFFFLFYANDRCQFINLAGFVRKEFLANKANDAHRLILFVCIVRTLELWKENKKKCFCYCSRSYLFWHIVTVAKTHSRSIKCKMNPNKSYREDRSTPLSIDTQ